MLSKIQTKKGLIHLFLINVNEISRTKNQKIDFKKKLKINDKINKGSFKKSIMGDNITLEIPKPKKSSLKPFNFKLIYFMRMMI